MKKPIFAFGLAALLLALLLSACGAKQTSLPPTPPAAKEAAATPQTDAVTDEGGPTRLVGGINYTDFSIKDVMEFPSPVLLDMVHAVQGDKTQWAPEENQILGRMTSPVFPPPLSYEFDLPVKPRGTYLDVDNDGEKDQGVQIFRLAMASNINGDSYLQQLDQLADLNSYLTDPQSGEITQGSLLIYADDDQQAFPNGFGDDGVLFTEDDPATPVKQGYTVVHFGPDGFTFDRSAEAQLNVLEAASAVSPDFSDQGIVESYNSLIDHLSTHYSFTDFRNLDWEAIRADYLPGVEKAEQLAAAGQQDQATAFYTAVLHRMAQSIHDAHVQVAIGDSGSPQAAQLARQLRNIPIATNIGANTAELDDGRIIVTDVITGTPAAGAGLVFGTEVLAVNGKPVEEVIPTVIYNQNTGTDSGQRLYQVANLLKFPAPGDDGAVKDVTIDVKLPGSDQTQTLTMTPGPYPLPDPLAEPTFEMPISFKLDPSYGYLTWESFVEPTVTTAVEEQFLSELKHMSQKSLILDLRGNSGGWDNLYFTMASYFFNEKNPVSMYWIDEDVYDPETDGLVRTVPNEQLISAPKPELYFDGQVVILVDNNCASSCEFFTQYMQTNGRAQVVSQYATKGAGASINRVDMPGGIIFQYTKGRDYFAGTDEFNLEAKGVTPDIKVPTTEETELAKRQGDDPVLAAGIQALKKAEFDLQDLQPAPYANGAITSVAPASWQLNEKAQQYTSPNQKAAFLFIPYTKDDQTDPDQIIGQIAPQADKVGEYEAQSGVWSLYTVDPTTLLAIANIDGKPYVGQLRTVDPMGMQVLVEELLQPALDAFEVTQPK